MDTYRGNGFSKSVLENRFKTVQSTSGRVNFSLHESLEVPEDI